MEGLRGENDWGSAFGGSRGSLSLQHCHSALMKAIRLPIRNGLYLIDEKEVGQRRSRYPAIPNRCRTERLTEKVASGARY
jgi:hypothetical protein